MDLAVHEAEGEAPSETGQSADFVVLEIALDYLQGVDRMEAGLRRFFYPLNDPDDNDDYGKM